MTSNVPNTNYNKYDLSLNNYDNYILELIHDDNDDDEFDDKSNNDKSNNDKFYDDKSNNDKSNNDKSNNDKSNNDKFYDDKLYDYNIRLIRASNRIMYGAKQIPECYSSELEERRILMNNFNQMLKLCYNYEH